MTFDGKAFLVAGATGNVGSALARLLAERGARVAVAGSSGSPLQTLAASLPHPERHASLADYDLTHAADGLALVTTAEEKLGPLHGVATTVGGFAMAPLAEAGPEHWDKMFALNVKTVWNLYRAAAPALRAAGGGSLVSIASAAALHGGAQMAAYAATKSAVLRLTESLAEELRADGIRVNAVLPTIIDTPQNRAAMPDADTTGWVQPLQVAEAMAFLLSDAASGITGALLPVG